MKSLISILSICLLTVTVYGQFKKQVNITRFKNSDTTLWYKWQHERNDKLKLPLLISDTGSFHFRLWVNGQTVDIWSQDSKTFSGFITNHTESHEYYKDNKTPKPPKTFLSKVQLDTSLSRQAFELVNTISSIPADDSIKDWGIGMDGITYIFETSTPTYYSFKTYWTPSSQDSSLAEAKQIQLFIDSMDSLLHLKAEYDKFFATLKPGSYMSNAPMVTTKFSERQKRKWRKYEPHWNYLHSIKDTLNNYLTDTLTKVFKASGDSLSEYAGDFFLKFSPQNKLVKITSRDTEMDSEDKQNFRSDKKKIKKAFSQIHVSFVHSKVSYWKTLRYSNEKMNID